MERKAKTMSIESANNIINEQDLTIEDLRHKVLDMTDERDLAIGKALKLVDEMKRVLSCETLWEAHIVAKNSVDDYNGIKPYG